ncbi:MAG: hypothetical protein KGP14_03300 [Betaproteobacteria bacterium]|nr:hypothetical protein [Betaproteobacteria bacterium]
MIEQTPVSAQNEPVAPVTPAAASPAPAAPVPTASVPSQPDAGVVAAPASPAAAPPVTPAADAPKWREDWRAAMAGGDDKFRDQLDRYASPEALAKAHAELQRKMSSGALKATLPENPTETDLAEYRKANAIPDKPDGYGIHAPQGVDLSDSDKKALGTFLADMHAANMPKAVVDKVQESYFKIRASEEQAAYNHAVDQTASYKAEIRTEYGRDYDRNVRLGNNQLVTDLGAEQAQAFAGLTLADGTKLGDNPLFVRYIVNHALQSADDGLLITSDGLNNRMDLATAYREAINLQFTDPKKYHSPEHQAQLMKLAAAKQRAA